MPGRVLISHDRKTMPGHFYRFLERREPPGLMATSFAIKELHMARACGEAE